MSRACQCGRLDNSNESERRCFMHEYCKCVLGYVRIIKSSIFVFNVTIIKFSITSHRGESVELISAVVNKALEGLRNITL